MQKEMFNDFINYTIEAFQQISFKMTGLNFTHCNEQKDAQEASIAVIIGIAGNNKENRGRLLFRADTNLAKMIADKVNGEDCADTLEFYLCISEFTNIFSGAAVSKLNNTYRGTELRLTPPAVFGGAEMNITTPKIYNESVYCKTETGCILLNIGFEGVK